MQRKKKICQTERLTITNFNHRLSYNYSNMN